MAKSLAFLSLIIIQSALSQWSTSPGVDAGLYVCPGFETGIVTFDDGSSIVLGLLSSRIYAQKLSPEGNKIWPQPVLVFQNDSSDMVLWSDIRTRNWYCADGDGGIIVSWRDYRGAVYTQVGPFNNALYMQRIDKNGALVWRPDGVQLAPIDGGIKDASLCSDGSGGVLVLAGESDFEGAGAAEKEWLWIEHFDSNGTRRWSQAADSSTSAYAIYPPGIIDRVGAISRFLTGSRVHFISTAGALVDLANYIPTGGLAVVSDSGAFEIRNQPDAVDSFGKTLIVDRVTRISSTWDSLWSITFEYPDEADRLGYMRIDPSFVSDGNNGLYHLWSFSDTAGRNRARLQQITSRGPTWPDYGLDIEGQIGLAIFPGKNGIGVVLDSATVTSGSIAYMFDENGRPVGRLRLLC